jgi:putative peptide zinc metalloprotease protein
MTVEPAITRPFILPQLKLDRIETALTEPRYMVTLVGQGRRLMIAPKLADLIVQLQQEKSLEEAAAALSELWGKEVDAGSLRLVIEQQMVRQGLAYAARHDAPAQAADLRRRAETPKRPLRERLLKGHFSRRLLKGKHVGKICAPLTILYEPLSVLLSLVLIVATRWVFYSTMDRHFIQQTLTQFNAAEYLTNIALLLVVILIHEFGHASAQLRFGVPTGGIGFQLYYYIPAFYTNVSASWSLKPRRRVVVDVGGIYFQSIAASVLCLVYLQTGSLAFLTAAVASDMLCLVSVNPFLRFDGYWLLSDTLAVPNLQKHSLEALKHCWRRLTRRPAASGAPPLSRWRMAALAVYAVLQNCFWVVLVFLIGLKARMIITTSAATISKFASRALEGVRAADAQLILASVLQLLLFVLLLMTVSLLVGKLIGKLYGFGRGMLARAVSRPLSGRSYSPGAAE